MIILINDFSVDLRSFRLLRNGWLGLLADVGWWKGLYPHSTTGSCLFICSAWFRLSRLFRVRLFIIHCFKFIATWVVSRQKLVISIFGARGSKTSCAHSLIPQLIRKLTYLFDQLVSLIVVFAPLTRIIITFPLLKSLEHYLILLVNFSLCLPSHNFIQTAFNRWQMNLLQTAGLRAPLVWCSNCVLAVLRNVHGRSCHKRWRLLWWHWVTCDWRPALRSQNRCHFVEQYFVVIFYLVITIYTQKVFR